MYSGIEIGLQKRTQEVSQVNACTYGLDNNNVGSEKKRYTSTRKYR